MMGRTGQIVTTVVFGALLTTAARAETFEDALGSARAGPRPAISRARYLAGSARVAIALANGRSSLSFSANATRNFDSDVYGPRLRDQTAAQLVIPLYAGGRVRASIDAARADEQALRERASADDLQLAVDVADVYGAVREGRVLRAAAKDEVSRLESISRRIDAERRAGVLASTDVAQARLHLAAAKRNAVAAERQEAVAAVRFEELVGHAPGRDLEPIPVDAPDTPGWESSIRAGNPELRSLRYSIDAARERVAGGRALGRPTVSLVAGASYGNTGAALVDGAVSDLPEPSQRLGSPRAFAHRFAASGLLVFKLPLSSGGQFASRTARAQADLRAAEARASEREAEVLAFARQALARARAALRQQRLVEQAIDSSGESLRGVEIARSIGIRSERDVMIATEELGLARRRQAQLERGASYQAMLALAAQGRLPPAAPPSPARVADGRQVASAMDRFDLARLPGSRIGSSARPDAQPRRPLAYDFSGLS